jgi:hypothetical protein
MHAQYWPLRIAQHDERDCANRQILLVADIFVGGDQHIKSGVLSCLQQFAVLELVPPSLRGCLDCVFFEEWTDRNWGTLVKENEHQRLTADEGVSSRLRGQIR